MVFVRDNSDRVSGYMRCYKRKVQVVAIQEVVAFVDVRIYNKRLMRNLGVNHVKEKSVVQILMKRDNCHI